MIALTFKMLNLRFREINGFVWSHIESLWLAWLEPPIWGFRLPGGWSSNTPRRLPKNGSSRDGQLWNTRTWLPLDVAPSPVVSVPHPWEDIFFPLILARFLVTSAFWHFSYLVKQSSLRICYTSERRTPFLKSWIHLHSENVWSY